MHAAIEPVSKWDVLHWLRWRHRVFLGLSRRGCRQLHYHGLVHPQRPHWDRIAAHDSCRITESRQGFTATLARDRRAERGHQLHFGYGNNRAGRGDKDSKVSGCGADILTWLLILP